MKEFRERVEEELIIPFRFVNSLVFHHKDIGGIDCCENQKFGSNVETKIEDEGLFKPNDSTLSCFKKKVAKFIRDRYNYGHNVNRTTRPGVGPSPIVQCPIPLNMNSVVVLEIQTPVSTGLSGTDA